jgi:dihydrofolate reductase
VDTPPAVSSARDGGADSAVHLHRGAALDLVRQLKAQEGRDMRLYGGAKLAAWLVAEIDELILQITPVLIARQSVLPAPAR